ncbi:ER membrane protein complex subunit 10-like [Acanthaster planci]|uniref:ER membrane protein complex subunit 10 n=1 Tax=Acanthaster planci TaxID=133434 RepID=A0A8B7XPF5_ACAPL|nr:ER membrane protein complex subunit 10-like [Acanthaster planci]
MAALTLRDVLSFSCAFFACFHVISGSRKGDQRHERPADDEFSGSAYSTDNTLLIEHSFEPGLNTKFTNRGTLNFRSLKAGSGSFNQATALTAGEKRKLREVAKTDGLYRIRVATKMGSPSDSEEVHYVSSFTKACALVESRLSDHITIHADQSGNVMGVHVLPLRGSCDQIEVESSALNYFNTTVSLEVTVPAPMPETQAYIQKLEEEKAQKAKGNSGDNRSFLAKYWMYIAVAVVIVMVTSGQQDAGGRGGGGGS